MRIKNVIFFLTTICLMACSTEGDDLYVVLTPDQQQLIGQGVDFSTSVASPFITRTTYQHNGEFNEGDQMRIFRQYATDPTGTKFDEDHEIFRTYYLESDNAPGTSVSFNSDWVPLKGKQKSYFDDNDKKVIEDQNEADSLTWESGATVRFRAWGRSNLAGHLKAGTSDSYYPDYTVSDWVTVSGPTRNIPLTMRHLAARVGIVAKPGNELEAAKICLDATDYDYEGGDADLEKVKTAIHKMCLPAGVDDGTFLLTAMTKELYKNLADTKDFENIEKSSEGIVTIGAKTAQQIVDEVQHPDFKPCDGRFYFLTIPIDMSYEYAGAKLTLPSCTRFKIKLYSINNGESEHIFTLGNVLPDGKKELTLEAGYSYTFSVGYRYKSLTVTPVLSTDWTIDPNTVTNEAQTPDQVIVPDYTWFTDAYVTSASNKYATPEFKIKDINQFVAFINLVNGTAHQGLPAITKGGKRTDDSGNVIVENGVNQYWWYVGDEQTPITSTEAKKRGYLFYYLFYKSVGDLPSYAEELCATEPLDFYDEMRGEKLHIDLTGISKDFDFADQSLPGIATAEGATFRGVFNGNGITMRNLKMQNGYLFENVTDGVISNLRIESLYPVCLVKSASASTAGWGAYIAGISMKCPSKSNVIADVLNGASFVAGCIHEGSHENTTGGALVGSVTKGAFQMVGCMQTADGIPSGSGALVGSMGSTATLGTFMYNYYDVQRSSGTHAIGTTADNYNYDDYVRGSATHILKAVENNKVDSEVYNKMGERFKAEAYGLAPWNAMNIGIEYYNDNLPKDALSCKMKYYTSEGYSNRYPELKLKK